MSLTNPALSIRALVCLAACCLTAACGQVVVQGATSSNGGEGGEGGGSGSGTSPPSATGGSGQGGFSSTSVSSGQGGAGGTKPSPCDGLGHAACIGAAPSCVPVYDDECCPSCDPSGGCADCSDIAFHHCAPVAACGASGPSCGFIPSWACGGNKLTCGQPNGSITPCADVPGCVLATCDPMAGCQPECHPVTGDSCTNDCDSVPPPCPPGTVAEADGFCYTGWCIPSDVCAP